MDQPQILLSGVLAEGEADTDDLDDLVEDRSHEVNVLIPNLHKYTARLGQQFAGGDEAVDGQIGGRVDIGNKELGEF